MLEPSTWLPHPSIYHQPRLEHLHCQEASYLSKLPVSSLIACLHLHYVLHTKPVAGGVSVTCKLDGRSGLCLWKCGHHRQEVQRQSSVPIQRARWGWREVPSVWNCGSEDGQCLWISLSSLGDSLNCTLGIVPCSLCITLSTSKESLRAEAQDMARLLKPSLGPGVNPHSQMGCLPNINWNTHTCFRQQCSG